MSTEVTAENLKPPKATYNHVLETHRIKQLLDSDSVSSVQIHRLTTEDPSCPRL